MLKFYFYTIILEQIDRISSKFVYALMLTRSRLGLLPVIFQKFVTELWPLIDVRRKDEYNLTNFCICINIDKIYVGFLCVILTNLQQSYDP